MVLISEDDVVDFKLKKTLKADKRSKHKLSKKQRERKISEDVVLVVKDEVKEAIIIEDEPQNIRRVSAQVMCQCLEPRSDSST